MPYEGKMCGMNEESTRGQSGQHAADDNREVSAQSGWVTTKQAARSLGISPRTVRWHIEQGNIVAEPQGEGVQRTWLVSIDSLQSFRNARQDATELPGSNRTDAKHAAIAADTSGSPIRELADRLAEEAARAAEYRVRLELTEQAQSTLEGEFATERKRREEAERERDELRRELEALQEARVSPETASPRSDRGTAPEYSQEPAQRRSWLHRFFFGP
jgi:predicted ArsR family transcriptional regulator